MLVKTTMVKVGVWDVPGVGTCYRYRVCTSLGWVWSIYKLPQSIKPEDVPDNQHLWEFVETGFMSKASAVEYVEELATLEEVTPPCEALLDNMEKVDPYEDLLNNIDDGIALNNEGGVLID